MRKRILLMFIFTSFIISGCTSIKYNEYMDKGKQALEKENYKEAIKLFENAVKEKPNEEAQKFLDESKLKSEVESKLNEGMQAIKEQELNEAILILTEIIDEGQSNPKLKDLIKEARVSLKEAKTQKEEVLLKIAQSSVVGKDYDYAITTLLNLLTINESNAEAKKLLKYSENMKNGSRALDSEQYDEAISLFAIALNVMPNDIEAIKLKEEAINSKKKVETLDASANIHYEENIVDENFNSNTSQVEGANINTIEEQDNAKMEFINTMNNLMNYYNQNVLNQLQGVPNMTSFSYLISTVGSIYRESVKVYVPYPEYQSIIDNWLMCLEATNKQLEMLKEVSNGNTNEFVANEYINEIFNYYQLTENDLNSIQ